MDGEIQAKVEFISVYIPPNDEEQPADCESSEPKRQCPNDLSSSSTNGSSMTNDRSCSSTIIISNSPNNNYSNTTSHQSLYKNLDWRRSPDQFNLLLACTGSVATIKLNELLAEIRKSCSATKYKDKLNVRIMVTENAAKFFDRTTVTEPIFDDNAEWELWKKRGDPVLHIELRKWADLLLIAPLDANTLAKIANGLCDNLVTSVIRAWDFKRTVLFCPAMNTYMYDHPLTVKHVEILTKLFGFREIPCIEKTLMCGDKGFGAMANPTFIASIVASEVKNHFGIITS